MDTLLSRMMDTVSTEQKMITAIRTDMVDHVQALIAEGVDVNARLLDQGGNAALHLACSKGHHQCVRLLLEANANPDIQNDFGIKPLAMALRNGHVECARMLLSTGSPYCDPCLVWLSHRSNIGEQFHHYTDDIYRLLLVATPDIKAIEREVPEYLIHKFDRPGKTLRTLILCGYQPSRWQVTHLQCWQSQEQRSWLEDNCLSVQSLQHHARLAVRRQLVPSPLAGVDQLPLPQKLKEYLLLNDVGYYT